MKRAAEKQLGRDDVDAANDESAPENPSHFERAAPDVLAKRRILKVRRTVPAQPAQTSAAKANPFASLQLPKAPATAASPPVSESASSDKIEDAAAANAPDVTADASADKQQSKPPQPPTTAAENAQEVAPPIPDKQKADAESAAADKPPAVERKSTAESEEKTASAPVESGVKKDEKAQHEERHSADGDDSDKRVSPAVPQAKNASAGEQAPTEEVDKAPPSETNTEQAATKHVESERGVQNGATAGASHPSDNVAEKEASENVTAARAESKPSSVGTNEAVNGTNAFTKLGSKPAIIFGGSGANNIKSFATAAKADGAFKFNAGGAAAPCSDAQSHEFKEQHVSSGEEEEETLFRMRSKLYSLEGESDKMRWKECGVGALKMNQHKENKRVRLLMRSEGVLRVILNTPLFKHVKLDRATERSVRFQGYEQRASKCYLLRFATHDACAEFIAAVEKWKETAEDDE